MKTKSTKIIVAISLALCASASFAQAANSTSSAAKKELITKLLNMQKPSYDMLARNLMQQPIGNLMQGASAAMQQVPPEKREATAKAIEADVKKFVDDNTPLIRDKAAKLAPSTVGAVLDERFSEDELKQLLAWLESPVNKKFGELNVEMQKSLADKLLADLGPTLETRFKTLQQAIGKQLGVSPAAAGASGSTAKPAKK
ncbi:DUF2059 domain-containing protein [Roseateles koreensis]|uniref:DUF2059 domain-containing protein n=1 Tax=Roseateles koreensis TaxID=2987526 RepID=A0ABT5KVH9_9BURK|nr:DUF2059 domain-containing protein [Roseateles koreensis]MDC8786943.1 DUF2059 domain-containing protein [Roseateles koreensis]